jgi:hypothetical protein
MFLLVFGLFVVAIVTLSVMVIRWAKRRDAERRA